MRMIARFSKKDDCKFCSHLDTQRIFGRSMSRANIPVSFSKGYNPHPLLSMAMALSVGYESEAEYLDITLEKDMDTDDFVEKMNTGLPAGFRILSAKVAPDKFSTLTSKVFCADYEITFDSKITKDFCKLIEQTVNKNDIIINKKTKSGSKPTDIKNMIYSLKFKDDTLYCRLSCGEVNLNPRDVVALLYDDFDYNVRRKHVYTKKDDKLIYLEDLI